MLGQWDEPTCELTDDKGALSYCNLYPDLQSLFCDGNECTLESQARLCQNHYNVNRYTSFVPESSSEEEEEEQEEKGEQEEEEEEGERLKKPIQGGGRDEKGVRKPGMPWSRPELMHPCSEDPPVFHIDDVATACEGTSSNAECTLECVAGYVPAPANFVLDATIVPGHYSFELAVTNMLKAGGDKAKCIGDAWDNDARDVRQCVPVPCPDWVSGDSYSPVLASTGFYVHSGCECNERLSGEITATQSAPYFAQTCAPNKCVVPPIDLGRSDKTPPVASWVGENCALDATDVHHGTVCTIVPSKGWTCTSPGRCIGEHFENKAVCTPNDCTVSVFADASEEPGSFGEGIAHWNVDSCRSGASDVTHLTKCEISPEFGYNCVSPGECYAEEFANEATCEAYSCSRPSNNEVMTTKHGKTWKRLDAYVFNEVDLRAPDRYFDVQVKCAPGFVGTPQINVCTEGTDSQYYVHGCNLDSDGDGIADDDEECENDPHKVESGICGCHKVDKDAETGHVNCATSEGIGLDRAFDGSHFYTLVTKSWTEKNAQSWKQAEVGTEFSTSEGGSTWLELNNGWSEKHEYGATEDNYAFSQIAETGLLFSKTFIIDQPVLAFQAGLGTMGTTIQLMTQAADGTFTRVRKELTPVGPVQEHFWDVSGMFQEHAQIVLTNSVDGALVYVNNMRMFHSEQGCIAECMTIVRSEHHDGIAFMGENEEQSMYLPVNKDTFEASEQELYCRDTFTGRLSFGAAPGAPFSGGFPDGIKYDNIDLDRMPSCIMIRVINDEKIEIAVTALSRRFQYSTLYAPEGIDSSSLHCVYPTKQPRCIDYFGILMNMRSAQMTCQEKIPAIVCVETALSLKCPLKANNLCGKEKMERDLLSCCDKDGNHPNNGCLNRRRLGHGIQISADTVLDADAAEHCARSCLKQPDDIACVGWRLEEGNNQCLVAYKCHLDSSPTTKAMGLKKAIWNLKTPDTNPFEGLRIGPHGGKKDTEAPFAAEAV
jgi:hypothetical protein